MATKDFKRKLSAILSADVAGYSRLMGEDEAATVSTLETYREVMSTLIKQHRGRVVDSPGDNVLAEFASVVDAVQCGVAVQNELQSRNAELPENRRMQFRIGINLGDVIEEGDRIYGDGVNIAARLEALGEPGGICISKTAFDHIETKLPLGYEYLGDQTVKNIAKPVGAYRVLMEPRVTVAGEKEKEKAVPVWRRKAILAGGVALVVVIIVVVIWNFYFRPPFEPASVEKMAFPLPDKPSIAVLPFVNMSDNPEQDFFSDGLTEEIITALSKAPQLFVIASNTSFTYKGKPVKVKNVSEELGVRYVIEGSVRRAGERVRVTAQMIDALKDRHLWAERYDKEFKDIFSIQDDITKKIITAVHVKLTEGERARVFAKGTSNLQAYLKAVQADWFVNQATKDSVLRAQQLAEEAIALDPNYAYAHMALGTVQIYYLFLGMSQSPRDTLMRAIKQYQKAVALNPESGEAHSLLAYGLVMARQYDKAVAECERAMVLEPNSYKPLYHCASALTFVGRREEAIPLFREALRINPKPPNSLYRHFGVAFRDSGRYDEAIEQAKKATERKPNDIIAYVVLASSYGLAGREEEAKAAAKEILRINPKFSVARLEKISPHKDRTVAKRFCDALRKAGLPDKPPLPLPDKPSIAVLPFANMSDDPKQEYFSDGLTEEIINALSKVSKLFVIARNSTFMYKGKPVKVQQVGRDLGVRYVLEGSVRKAEDRVRITAQLIDATTGHHLWSERYDRDLKDIFALQDEITMKIISAMQVELTEGEDALELGRRTSNLNAYLKTLQALDLIIKFNKESVAMAQRLSEEAITLDPEYASAYRVLGVTHMHDVFLGRSKSPKESMANAIKFVKKAIALDNSEAESHSVLGSLYAFIRQYDKAVLEGELAVTLNPNSADAHAWLGMTYRYVGRWEEAIEEYKAAIRLNPMPPVWYLYGIGLAYAITGRYEEGIKECGKAVSQAPNSPYTHMHMTMIYGLAGLEEEARTQAKELLRVNPKFSVEHWKKRLTYKNENDKEQMINALLKAGLK